MYLHIHTFAFPRVNHSRSTFFFYPPNLQGFWRQCHETPPPPDSVSGPGDLFFPFSFFRKFVSPLRTGGSSLIQRLSPPPPPFLFNISKLPYFNPPFPLHFLHRDSFPPFIPSTSFLPMRSQLMIAAVLIGSALSCQLTINKCGAGLTCCLNAPNGLGDCYNETVQTCASCGQRLVHPCPLEAPNCCIPPNWEVAPHKFENCYPDSQKCCNASGLPAAMTDICIGSCGVTSDPFEHCCERHLPNSVITIHSTYDNRTHCCALTSHNASACDLSLETCTDCGCIAHNDHETKCCGEHKYNTSATQCCEGGQMCSMGTVCSSCGCLTEPESSCCQGRPFNPKMQTCCSDGHTIPAVCPVWEKCSACGCLSDPTLQCCGSQQYNATKETCCHTETGVEVCWGAQQCVPYGPAPTPTKYGLCCLPTEEVCYRETPREPAHCFDPAEYVCCEGVKCGADKGCCKDAQGNPVCCQ